MALYFQPSNLQTSPEADLSSPHETGRLNELHDRIYTQFRTYGGDLSVYRRGGNVVGRGFPCLPGEGDGLSIWYMRVYSQAATIERLMGREGVFTPEDIQPCRHPIIELRLTPEHFIIELAISRDAWWDAQNLAGKLMVQRFRQQFYTLLRGLPPVFRLGYWHLSQADEMYLEGEHLRQTVVVDDWLSTFEPGKDWFRLGRWYPLDDALLNEDTIQQEVLSQLRRLHEIYTFAAWTGHNNFRDFYVQESQPAQQDD
jgi:hypothetical protein